MSECLSACVACIKGRMQHSQINKDLLQRARRMALRSRAAMACPPCKASKTRCSDGRPCARCKKAGNEFCTDTQSVPRSTSLDTSLSSTAVYDLSDHNLDNSAEYFMPLLPAFSIQRSFVINSTFSPRPTTVHPEVLHTWSDEMDMGPKRGFGLKYNGGSSAQLAAGQVRGRHSHISR